MIERRAALGEGADTRASLTENPSRFAHFWIENRCFSCFRRRAIPQDCPQRAGQCAGRNSRQVPRATAGMHLRCEFDTTNDGLASVGAGGKVVVVVGFVLSCSHQPASKELRYWIRSAGIRSNRGGGMHQNAWIRRAYPKP